MKLGCILPILAIGLVAVGAQGLYVGLTNRKPSAMTYQEFLEKKPSSGWLEISDARLNLLSAIHESNRFTGTIKKVYIPVGSSAAGERAGEGAGDGKVHLLLLTKDEAILQTLKGLEAATGGGGGLIGRLKNRVEANKKGEAGPQTVAADPAVEKALRFMVENRDKVMISRPVRGLIQSGLDSMSHGDRRKIQSMDPNIAEDFAVLEDGAQPQVAASFAMIIAGLALAGLLLFWSRRTKQSTPAAPGSSAERSPPAAPKSPKDPEFWASDTE
jgi:hypothetical protein